ncbi:MAG: hypothetical protein LQ348_005110 [Seirophora lacunosa]|nr:MAG: hypothetical protein LQ344_007421 [Seirophora lacunosa]KAI4180991.1 MAG: hypothetical protein LQ348_005110 [Seirophora lacunosa]
MAFPFTSYPLDVISLPKCYGTGGTFNPWVYNHLHRGEYLLLVLLRKHCHQPYHLISLALGKIRRAKEQNIASAQGVQGPLTSWVPPAEFLQRHYNYLELASANPWLEELISGYSNFRLFNEWEYHFYDCPDPQKLAYWTEVRDTYGQYERLIQASPPHPQPATQQPFQPEEDRPHFRLSALAPSFKPRQNISPDTSPPPAPPHSHTPSSSYYAFSAFEIEFIVALRLRMDISFELLARGLKGSANTSTVTSGQGPREAITRASVRSVFRREKSRDSDLVARWEKEPVPSSQDHARLMGFWTQCGLGLHVHETLRKRAQRERD